jgi:hypothetical protein
MEEVIRKIIQIELDAKKMMNDALEEKKAKEEEHNRLIKELQTNTLKRANDKIEQIRQREFQEIEESEIQKKQRCELRLRQMDAYAKENMETWVEQLVKRVLS